MHALPTSDQHLHDVPVMPGMRPDTLKHSLNQYLDHQLLKSRVLRQSISHLLSRYQDWQRESQTLSSISVEVQWVPSPERMDTDGDVVIFKTMQGGFGALVREAGQWNQLLPTGKTTVPPANLFKQMQEAILLRLPQKTNQQNLSGIALIGELLKSTWVEIGLGSLLINVGVLLLPLFSMLIYDKVVNNGVFETLWALTFGMLIYIVADLALRHIRAWSMENVAHQLSRKADQSLWQKILGQSEFQMGFSKLLTYYRDLSTSRDFISSYYMLALMDVPFLLVYLLAMSMIAWPLAVTTVVLVIIYSLLSHLVQSRLSAASQETERFQSQKMSFLSESLHSLDVIKTSPQQRQFEHKWQSLSAESALQDARKRYTGNMINLLSSSLSTLTSVTILVVGAYLIDAKLLSVGGLIACNLLASRSMSIVTAFYTVFGKWQDFQRAYNKLHAEIQDENQPSPLARTAVKGNIQIVRASKSYSKNMPSLNQINLHIHAGERVGLLGKPGAGKTTLLRAISGLSTLDEGSIMIDGVDLKHLSQQDRSRWLAWKGQEPGLFAGTLEDNLLISETPLYRERLERAIWMTGLEDDFKTGKLSLGMHIHERGQNLSGGQRQKVALARALTQPATILLLDEPTLGFDPDTERHFAERLQQSLPSEITLVMTTHSSLMLPLTHRVIVLDEGKVFADGPTEKVTGIKSYTQA